MKKRTIDDVINSLKVTKTRDRVAMIRKAYDMALRAHAGQKRRSGEDYIQHPLGYRADSGRNRHGWQNDNRGSSS